MDLPTPLRVRFAPSPTGDLHLGSALTALANAALVRDADDDDAGLVLRIDDTDVARSIDASADAIVVLLGWLGIGWQAGPVTQSSRAARHAAAVTALLDGGRAYHCFCSELRLAELADAQRAAHEPPRYDGRCAGLDADEAARRVAAGEAASVRLRVAGHPTSFHDLIHGDVAVPAASFGDYVIARSDGSATYLLASVVDDVDLGITLVCRGEDHLPNTGRQLALFAALGADAPAFAHLPLLRAAGGRKLSKRDPLGSVDQLRSAGYLPGAIRRYLAQLLGQGEVDPLATGAPAFDLARVPRSAPHVDHAQLDACARHAMAEASLLEPGDPDDLGEQLARHHGLAVPPRALPLLRDAAPGCATLAQLAAVIGAVLVPPDDGIELPAPWAPAVLDAAIDAGGGEGWAEDAVAAIKSAARERDARVGDALRSARLALTGTDHGPALPLVLDALGPDEVRRRLSARTRA